MSLSDDHIWFVQTIPREGLVDIARMDDEVCEKVPVDLAEKLVAEHNKAIYDIEAATYAYVHVRQKQFDDLYATKTEAS